MIKISSSMVKNEVQLLNFNFEVQLLNFSFEVQLLNFSF